MKDAETGRTQTYSTSSDVLAQQFAVRVGPTLYRVFSPTSRTNAIKKTDVCETSIPLPTQVPVLFNGCRSGEIFSIDLRQRGRRDNSRKANRFHQESAITSLHILRDENYLIAADMQGQVRASALNLRTSARKRPHILPSSSISRPFGDILMFFSRAQIKLWDVRATKSVQEYKGHHNEHAYLPVHVCEDEGLLLAGRKDGAKNVESIYALFPNPHFQSLPSSSFCHQPVRIATHACGASRTAACSGPSRRPTRLPTT